MADRLEPHVREAFDAETRRIMARRVPLGVAFFVGVVLVSGLIEWSYYPDRLKGLVVSFTSEMALCGIAILVSRHAALRRYVIPVTSAATVGVTVCVTLYVAATGASGDALALALIIFLPGVALLYPWGLRGQVPFVVGTLTAYVLALVGGVRGELPLPYGIGAVAGSAVTSLVGAVFLDMLRRAVFHQQVLLERARDEQMATLYDVTRTVTETLELRQVVRLVCQGVLGALRLERLWLFWREAPEGEVQGLSAATKGTDVVLVDLERDPERWETLLRAEVDGAPVLLESSPDEVAALADVPLVGGRLLRLPLDFRSERIGIILADTGGNRDRLSPSFFDFAATLATSGAMALANARLHALVVDQRTQLRRLSKRGLATVEDILRRISRELHDNTCQALMAIKLDLSLLDRKLVGPAATLRENVRDIHQQVVDVMHGVREMSHLIRPPVLDEFGAVAAIESVAAKYREGSDLQVRVVCPTSGVRFPAAIELLLFRIFQEALINIVKHAHAKRVEVRVVITEGSVRLDVEDDGCGFDAQIYFRRPSPNAGLGLLGMRERLAYYGGTFEITSRAGTGTCLTARVPVEPLVRAEVATAG
jgi:signal transduction histidine kinase